MIQAIKKYFTFDYLSPLDYETCKERLTSEYRERFRAENKGRGDVKSSWFGWYTSIYQHKKGGVLVDSDWGRLTLPYRITLEQSGNGTILHCTNNPLGLNAWFFPMLGAAFLSVGTIAGIIDYLVVPRPGSPIAKVIAILILALFIVCILLAYLPFETYARNAVTRLVGQLVGAVPMK